MDYGVVVHPVDGAGAVIDGEYYYARDRIPASPLDYQRRR